VLTILQIGGIVKANSVKSLVNDAVLLEKFDRKPILKVKKVKITPVESDDDGLTIPDYRKTLAKI